MLELLSVLKSKISIYIISSLIVILLFSAYSVKVYNMGIEHEKVSAQKLIKKQEKEFNTERDALNSKIKDLSKDLVVETQSIEAKQEKIRESVHVYSKNITNNTNNTNDLDAEWLRIYNDSLPE